MVGQDEEPQRNGWLDRVTDWCVVRAGGKVRGLSLVESDDGSKGIQVRLLLSAIIHSSTHRSPQLLLSLSNNSLESYTVPTPPVANAATTKSARQLKAASTSGQIEPVRTHVLERQGHRADVRCLSVSSDDQVLASAANGEYGASDQGTSADTPRRFVEDLESQDGSMYQDHGMRLCNLLHFLAR